MRFRSVRFLVSFCSTFRDCQQQRRDLNTYIFSADNRFLVPGRIITTHDSIDQPLRYGVIVAAPSRQPNSERYFQILEFTALGTEDRTAEVKRVACGDLHRALNALVKINGDAVVSEAEKAKTSNKIP